MKRADIPSRDRKREKAALSTGELPGVKELSAADLGWLAEEWKRRARLKYRASAIAKTERDKERMVDCALELIGCIDDLQDMLAGRDPGFLQQWRKGKLGPFVGPGLQKGIISPRGRRHIFSPLPRSDRP